MADDVARVTWSGHWAARTACRGPYRRRRGSTRAPAEARRGRPYPP
uniref:Uncharacterized protein n=1 Tax=Arundo donax TaxID=35708 RepID=A0A0A9B7C3_ARUDO